MERHQGPPQQGVAVAEINAIVLKSVQAAVSFPTTISQANRKEVQSTGTLKVGVPYCIRHHWKVYMSSGETTPASPALLPHFAPRTRHLDVFPHSYPTSQVRRQADSPLWKLTGQEKRERHGRGMGGPQ